MSTAAAEQARALRALSPAELERFNRQGPRYTSYPTAPEWTPDVTEAMHREGLRDTDPNAPLSLYFHIPFCEHRCRFCGCNVIVSKKPEITAPYLENLDREMAIVKETLGASAKRPVTQVHLGGGTPTYLAPAQLEDLMRRVHGHFHLADHAEISIEVDPCVTTDAHMDALAAAGFNRVSFGVQDFHRPTQEIIERLQSVEETAHIAQRARDLGFESVNFDLVYGLPLQTPGTFAATMEEVLKIRPDRVALYNFAYLPKRLANQRRIDPETLPSGPQKFEIFVSSFERFVEAGYEFIGMDHFALPEDTLAKARRDRTIQRNFMGYTTQAGTDMLSFGVSSISATDHLYVQNVKILPEYQAALDAGKLPVERGCVVSDEDRLRRAVIYDLMCHGLLVKSSINERFGVDFDAHFAPEIEALAPLVADGLLEIHADRLEITLLGHIFVRNVAMVFDTYLRAPRAQPTFSKTL